MKINELFKLVEGANVWNLTSSDTAITFGGDTYTPYVIGRNEVENKNELSRANVEVSFNIDSSIARRWLNGITDTNVTITIWSKQDSVYSVIWKGSLAGVKPDIKAITLIFENVLTALRQSGLRARYQRSCRHVLYGRGCKLDKENFDIAGTASAISGSVVTVAAAASYADQYFRGGMLEAPGGTLRFILSHVGNQITLIRPIKSLTDAVIIAPTAVRLFPGCDRSMTVCNGTFNNLPNNGSFPFIPLRNPFSGVSLT